MYMQNDGEKISDDICLLGKETKHVLSKHLVLMCAPSEFSDLPPSMTLLVCSVFGFEILWSFEATTVELGNKELFGPPKIVS